MRDCKIYCCSTYGKHPVVSWLKYDTKKKKKKEQQKKHQKTAQQNEKTSKIHDNTKTVKLSTLLPSGKTTKVSLF